MLKKYNDTISKCVDCIIVISCVFILLCITLQILTRFIFHIPMPWTEEYSRYAFVWLAMFGSAKAAREKTHIFVDILEVAIKGKIAKYCGIAAHIVTLLFLCILLYVSIPWVIKNLDVDTVSVPALRLGWFYLGIPLGGAFMLLFTVETLIDHIAADPAKNGGD